jgi:hypothetical protein
VWKRRVIEAFAILTAGGRPQSSRRIRMRFVEKPDRMRVLGTA